MELIRYLGRSLLHPTPVVNDKALMRQILLKPRIFDALSCVMQWKDRHAVKAISEQNSITDPYTKHVHDYNVGVTAAKVITRTRRAEELYRVITLAPRDCMSERLLVIGPRDVHELLMAWLYGYKWKNIASIDLYATNKKIQVMDMENMTFPDETFDAVTMANTLAYAKDTKRCLSEIARVLRPGGRLVFGATYCPQSDEFAGNKVSGEQIRAILRDLQLCIYFYRPSDKTNSLGFRQTSHLFGVEKTDSSNPGFDRISW